MIDFIGKILTILFVVFIIRAFLPKNPNRKHIKKISKKGYTFAFDTNFLIDYPYVLGMIKNSKVVICKTVINELEGLKNNKPHLRRQINKVFQGLLQHPNVKEVQVDLEYQRKKGLINYTENGSDEKVIASYLKLQEEGEQIIFCSGDFGAQRTAKQYNIPTFNFRNIKKSIFDKFWYSKKALLWGAVGIFVIFYFVMVPLTDSTNYKTSRVVNKLSIEDPNSLIYSYDNDRLVIKIIDIKENEYKQTEITFSVENNLLDRISFPVTPNEIMAETVERDRYREITKIYGNDNEIFAYNYSTFVESHKERKHSIFVDMPSNEISKIEAAFSVGTSNKHNVVFDLK